MSISSIPTETRIGHVHLRVADLDRSVRFYQELMGFDLMARLGGQPPARGSTGLYHFAINYPTRRDLAVALKRLLDGGWSIDGASDHGTHEAIYLHDPDFNGIELAWDRAQTEWPRQNGQLFFGRKPLDFAGLLAELGEPDHAGYVEMLSVYK